MDYSGNKHPRSKIRKALLDVLTDSNKTPSSIFVGRHYPLSPSQLPGIFIDITDEVPNQTVSNNCVKIYERSLFGNIYIHADGPTEIAATDNCENIAREVELLLLGPNSPILDNEIIEDIYISDVKKWEENEGNAFVGIALQFTIMYVDQFIN